MNQNERRASLESYEPAGLDPEVRTLTREQLKDQLRILASLIKDCLTKELDRKVRQEVEKLQIAAQIEYDQKLEETDRRYQADKTAIEVALERALSNNAELEAQNADFGAQLEKSQTQISRLEEEKATLQAAHKAIQSQVMTSSAMIDSCPVAKRAQTAREITLQGLKGMPAELKHLLEKERHTLRDIGESRLEKWLDFQEKLNLHCHRLPILDDILRLQRKTAKCQIACDIMIALHGQPGSFSDPTLYVQDDLAPGRIGGFKFTDKKAVLESISQPLQGPQADTLADTESELERSHSKKVDVIHCLDQQAEKLSKLKDELSLLERKYISTDEDGAALSEELLATRRQLKRLDLEQWCLLDDEEKVVYKVEEEAIRGFLKNFRLKQYQNENSLHTAYLNSMYKAWVGCWVLSKPASLQDV